MPRRKKIKIQSLTLESFNRSYCSSRRYEDKDIVYDDTAIRNLIAALQNKEDKDTAFDPSALEARITALEGKADKDTVYDDTALAAQQSIKDNSQDKADYHLYVKPI